MSRSRRYSSSEGDDKLLFRSLTSPRVSDASSEDRPATPPPHLKDVHGILKTHDDKDLPLTPSQHRVSFARHMDGTINRRVSMSDSPRYVGANGSPFASPQAASSRPSLKKALSPPPLPSSKKSNLADVHPKTSKVQLPFSTPVKSDNRSYHARRTSMPEVGPTANDRGGSPKKQRVTYSRRDYKLGQALRSPTHMIIENCPQAAMEKVSQLKNYDFAFIKRSDGSWTYAILAFRSEEEECMMFVMNEGGSTKVIKKNQWAKWVRCVATDEEPLQRGVVPRSVSVLDNGEDCSMVTYLS